MKKPLVAAILSFFLPGVGQIYAGAFDRGLVISATTVLFVFLHGILTIMIEAIKGNVWKWAFENFVHLRGFTGADFLSIVVMVTLLWAFQVYDAYKIAKTNQGILQRMRKQQNRGGR